MKRIGLLGLVSVLLLGACATAAPEKASYSVTPQVQVTVRSPKKKVAQSTYRAAPAPDQAPLSGSGDSIR